MAVPSANLVFFGWLIWTVAGDTMRRAKTSIGKWAPGFMVTLGCALAMIDPTRHVLLDHGGVFFQERTLAMYKDGHLSTIGKFSQMSTWIGLSILFCGMLLYLDILYKLFSIRI
mmetsp:Transcript_70395/g.228878  ORF Transcript_70395/g.228878 Transcript_70395/m.228878 type:complete len:114 (+) Transcript_70395:428-769(+)